MGLFSWLFSFKPVLRTPEQVTRYVLANYDQMKELNFREMEAAVRQQRSVQSHLLYALRISSVLPTLKTIKTLASRWSVAHCGAGGLGLSFAASAPLGREVCKLLESRYTAALARMLEAQAAAQEVKILKARTDARKAELRLIFAGDLQEQKVMFVPHSEEFDKLIDSYRNRYFNQ